MLFPKYCTQNNKFGMENRIKFALCYERWRSTQQLSKNLFNFKAEKEPDNFEVERHNFEQKPIVIDDDVELKADVPDTKKPLATKISKVDATDGKENVPTPPPPPITYAYAPTMCTIPEFDQKYSLPKITKKAPKVNEKKLAAREQKKKMRLNS